jgi:hypothetical protein
LREAPQSNRIHQTCVAGPSPTQEACLYSSCYEGGAGRFVCAREEEAAERSGFEAGGSGGENTRAPAHLVPRAAPPGTFA